MGEEAVDALYQVHQTVFDPINSADLCKFCGKFGRSILGRKLFSIKTYVEISFFVFPQILLLVLPMTGTKESLRQDLFILLN